MKGNKLSKILNEVAEKSQSLVVIVRYNIKFFLSVFSVGRIWQSRGFFFFF